MWSNVLRSRDAVVTAFARRSVDALFQETSRCRKTAFIDIWPDLVKPFLKRARSFFEWPGIDISHSRASAGPTKSSGEIYDSRLTTLAACGGVGRRSGVGLGLMFAPSNSAAIGPSRMAFSEEGDHRASLKARSSRVNSRAPDYFLTF